MKSAIHDRLSHGRLVKWIAHAALVAASSMFIAGVAHAQAAAMKLPATPAGKVLRAWLDAFNSGDSLRLGAYYRQYEPGNFSPASPSFQRETGGFDVVTVEHTDPQRIDVTLKERRSARVVYGIVTTPSDGSMRVMTFRLTPLGENTTASVAHIDAATRARVIEGALKLLDQRYVFPLIAKQIGDSLRARLQRGAYDAFTNGVSFGVVLRDEIREIAHDKHLNVDYSVQAPVPSPASSVPSAVSSAARERAEMEAANCFFVKAERLADNIGYLKFDGFAGADLCGATATSAMDFLANTRALVIDLRENGGGDPAMVAHIASYLFSHRTQLSSIFQRVSGNTVEYWTADSVPGRKFGGEKPIFVLTAARTFSAAEALAYDLKSLKRATIVGETTGGGANPGSMRRIDDHFTIVIPAARAINPITRTNWEGVGVEPDVKVSAPDALAAALRLLAQQPKS